MSRTAACCMQGVQHANRDCPHLGRKCATPQLRSRAMHGRMHRPAPHLLAVHADALAFLLGARQPRVNQTKRKRVAADVERAPARMLQRMLKGPSHACACRQG
eukprot:364933-Chlamydomonas_euryale.AAC.21